MFNPRQATGFVIYRKNMEGVTEYLLLQTSEGEFPYSPPKGIIKKNEGFMQAAFRETEEETGIKEDELSVDYLYQKFMTYFSKSKNANTGVVFWLARLIQPNQTIKLSREHKSYVWWSLEEALKKVEHPKIKKLLTYFDECVNEICSTPKE